MPSGNAPTETAVPAETRVEQLLDELRHVQRLAALGELASTTTHEFNNVLMTILNYAKLGLRYKDDATREKAFTKILDAAKRAEKITNGVLGMARNRGTEKVPTDLAEIVKQSLLLLERELRKYRVQVETKFSTERKALVCGNQIQQVLMNLLTNARQAMPRGGHIEIGVAEDAAAATVDLTVRDDGSGIPTEQLPKIFDRFYTTKQGPDASGKGGTGLGLAMCRDIVESHHGRIRVESSPGIGTAFTLKLPIAHEHTCHPTVAVPTLGMPIQSTSAY